MAEALRIFIASASEGLDVANAVHRALERNDDLDPYVWDESTFKPSRTFIESLEWELAHSDYAVVTLTPDDEVVARKKVSMAPRDNVLFELGLSMGDLGRDRTFFVCRKDEQLKIPTDLLGVSPVSYSRSEGQDLDAALSDACDRMAKLMGKAGPRPKHSDDVEREARRVTRFCEHVSGSWWERVTSQDQVKLSCFRMTPDPATRTVQMDGDGFDSNGQCICWWKSTAVGVRAEDRMLFYSWKGKHPKAAPGGVFKGFGQFTFQHPPGPYHRGYGEFADIHVGQDKKVVWKSVDLHRLEEGDRGHEIEQVMKKGSDADRAREVLRVLRSLEGTVLAN